jgi:hypothetical protein
MAAWAAVAWIGIAPALVAESDLVLYRRTAEGVASFFVRGAAPGELIFLTTDDGLLPVPPVAADASGGACLQLQLGTLPLEPIALQAVVEGAGRGPRWSNRVLLRDPALLWMVVERADSTTLVRQCDASSGEFADVRRGPARRDGTLTAQGNAAFVKERNSIVALEDLAVRDFPPGEEPIDLALSADGSALITLTRESLPDGAGLLRARLLEAGAIHREIGAYEIARGESRLLSAWLVPADDSHRALVVERGGAIHELVLDDGLSRGTTLLPLTVGSREELVDCAVQGERLAVITRSPVSRSAGRLLLVDLARREPVRCVDLTARPYDLELFDPGGGAEVAVLVATQGGLVLRVDWSTARRRTLVLPGVLLLARSADGQSCFAAADAPAGGSGLFRIDPETLGVEHFPELGPIERAADLGAFAADGREWVWMVERRFLPTRNGGADVDDRLWCGAIDAAGEALDATSVITLTAGGMIRRVAAR